ncbi:hypothetical protein GMOD_00004353 [Pyrenophora seminiperda CCB06]|uniref:Uncharacterized protein n=1 Tax=Pyrenophora seminiperda CCB06 TaxID=1302712 RepID=A0A3M7M154_9PLEO|nr:hypothetical protein GMOD_00004353 [Pyrenophora seminiperda CCB06]
MTQPRLSTVVPQFLFSMDEIGEDPNAPPSYDREGKWMPPLGRHNQRVNRGVSYNWWYCNGRTVQFWGKSLPDNASAYSAFSTYFKDGHGFWVLRGDATSPPAEESWHCLRFNHSPDYSSSLTNVGTHSALQCHNSTHFWHRMLLPDIYHGPGYAGYGGLTGDLPIFLSLLAFSMPPKQLQHWLPVSMENSKWQGHQLPNGRTDKRGVIVNVCAVGGNDRLLRAYEDGDYGKYY